MKYTAPAISDVVCTSLPGTYTLHFEYTDENGKAEAERIVELVKNQRVWSMHQLDVNGLVVDLVRKDIKNLHLAVYPPHGRGEWLRPCAWTMKPRVRRSFQIVTNEVAVIARHVEGIAAIQLPVRKGLVCRRAWSNTAKL
jgi:hypothetical protein